MLHTTGSETYLFGFTRMEDGHAEWDEWYETEAQAMASGEETYGALPSAWQEIPDPLPDCQQDWIHPVRVKGRSEGEPQYGKYEKFIAGEWIDFDPAD